MADQPPVGRGRGRARGRGGPPRPGPPPGPPPRPPSTRPELGAIPKTARPPPSVSGATVSSVSSTPGVKLDPDMSNIAGVASEMSTVSISGIEPKPVAQTRQTPSSDESTLTKRMKDFEGLDISSGSGSSRPRTTPEETMEEEKMVKKTYRGTEGKELDLNSNYLRLEIAEGKGIFEYEVSYDPQIDNRNMRFKLLNQHREIIGPEKSFDGTKLYLPVKLPENPTSAPAQNPETGEEVKVIIKFKRQKAAGDRTVVQFFNILFNRIFRELQFTQHLRKNFDPKGAHNIPQYNLQVWPGYVTAVDNYEGGLLLQIDVSHRVLRTDTVRDVLLNLMKSNDGKERAIKELLGARVLTKYNNKTYRIDDIDFDAKPTVTFTNSKGEEISYMDYYKNQYGLTITDLKQPLLLSRHKSKFAGEKDVEKIVCLIPELCLMTGMTEQMRADFRIMKAVSEFTRVTPDQRRVEMQKFLARMNQSEVAKKMLSNWGLKLSPTPIHLKGRVLPLERIYFGGNYSEAVTPKGDWGRSATSKKCLTGITLHKWAVVFSKKDGSVCQKFCQEMQRFGPRIGINIANPKAVPVADDRTDSFISAIRPLVDPNVQMIMIVVPQMKSDRYSAIKKLLCVEKACPSQVILAKTIKNEKKMSSVAQKVVLQMNCKVGGELWSCSSPFKDIMVVGIDVFHDKSRKSGSIAGLVTSLNDQMTRYHSSVAIQKQGQEIVDAIKTGFAEALHKYWDVNHKWPQHIVVFRDGVGDGQMEATQSHEVTQFISTFRSIRNMALDKRLKDIVPKNYDPGFNFIVVQKRINTRLFKSGKAFENPPPGTVVDHTVTRYNFADFFLVPQNVNLGTVSPTHYIVLEEAGSKPLNANQIQKLTYLLSHLYWNWPGTVKVPAPCQYAHKLVELVGESIKQVPSPQLSDKLYFL